ncbi:MAG: hypothetical protein ABI639_00075 [Thermoanaerobaculia bacterium]
MSSFDRDSFSTLRAALVTVAGLFAAVAPPVAAQTFTPTPADFRFESLNRSYTDFIHELSPIEEGGMTIQLTSPSQTLLLRDHRIRLYPVSAEPDGEFSGQVELDVQGKGGMIIDLAMGPIARRITDEIVIPPQTIRLAGRVRIQRVGDGYEVVPERLPKTVEVTMQSKGINQILALCDQAATLTMGAVDCSGLAAALTKPGIPIPGGDLTFHLGDDVLSAADRARLDALLPPPPPPSATP